MPKAYIQLGASGSSPSICPARATGCSEILFHGNISICLLGQADDGTPVVQLQRRHCQHLLPEHHQVLSPVSNNRVDIVKKEQSSCCTQCDNLYKTATYINVSSKSHKFFFYNRSMFG